MFIVGSHLTDEASPADCAKARRLGWVPFPAWPETPEAAIQREHVARLAQRLDLLRGFDSALDAARGMPETVDVLTALRTPADADLGGPSSIPGWPTVASLSAYRDAVPNHPAVRPALVGMLGVLRVFAGLPSELPGRLDEEQIRLSEWFEHDRDAGEICAWFKGALAGPRGSWPGYIGAAATPDEARALWAWLAPILDRVPTGSVRHLVRGFSDAALAALPDDALLWALGEQPAAFRTWAIEAWVPLRPSAVSRAARSGPRPQPRPRRQAR